MGQNIKNGGSSLANFGFFLIFFKFKMRPKNQNMKPQKRYLEVSRSIRKEVRAFFSLYGQTEKLINFPNEPKNSP
jgi:hypothetical protein